MLKGKFGEIFKKVLIIVGGLAFILGSGSTVIKMMIDSPAQQTETTPTETLSPEENLKQQAKGYENVLKNEPNNRFALEQLVKVYLELGNLQAAINPTEKLVKLDPTNQRYQEVLEKIKAGLAQQKEAPSNQKPSSPSEENKQKN